MKFFPEKILIQNKVPSTIHADHLIAAENGSVADLKVANDINSEVIDCKIFFAFNLKYLF